MSLPNDFLVKPSMCLERIKDRKLFFPISVHTSQLSLIILYLSWLLLLLGYPSFTCLLFDASFVTFYHITSIVSLSTQTSTTPAYDLKDRNVNILDILDSQLTSQYYLSWHPSQILQPIRTSCLPNSIAVAGSHDITQRLISPGMPPLCSPHPSYTLSFFFRLTGFSPLLQSVPFTVQSRVIFQQWNLSTTSLFSS